MFYFRNRRTLSIGAQAVLVATLSMAAIQGSTASNAEKMLFDFTSPETKDLSGWTEESDVVREPGMSKAVLVLQKTAIFQRAVFFTLLNPQPNGAAFAGCRIKQNINLSKYNNIVLDARGQGGNKSYKIVLRHKGQNHEPFPTYETFFEVPINEFGRVTLPLKDFKPYFRGRQLNDTEPLDTSAISMLGLQIYGGVYSPIKQVGPASLEINWIKATE